MTGVTASDNVDGDITSSINVSGDAFNETSAAVGTYTILYDVNDDAGNSAVQKSKTITVEAAAATLTEGVIINTTTGEVRLYDSSNAVKTINSFTWEGVPITEFIYGGSFTGIQAVTNQVDSSAHTDGINPFLADGNFQCSAASSNMFGDTPAKFTGGSGASPGYLTGDDIIFTIDLSVTGAFTSSEIPSVWKFVYNDATEINQDSSGYNFQLTS